MSNRFPALALLLAACTSSTPPAESPEASPAEGAPAEQSAAETAPPAEEAATPVAASKPDAAKFTKHLREHVSYPATRDTLLAACADTGEFSPAERQWASDNLPEGSYATAADVEKALGLAE